MAPVVRAGRSCGARRLVVQVALVDSASGDGAARLHPRALLRAESAPFQYPTLDVEARTVLAAIADDARAALGAVMTAERTGEGSALDVRMPRLDGIGATSESWRPVTPRAC